MNCLIHFIKWIRLKQTRFEKWEASPWEFEKTNAHFWLVLYRNLPWHDGWTWLLYHAEYIDTLNVIQPPFLSRLQWNFHEMYVLQSCQMSRTGAVEEKGNNPGGDWHPVGGGRSKVYIGYRVWLIPRIYFEQTVLLFFFRIFWSLFLGVFRQVKFPVSSFWFPMGAN